MFGEFPLPNICLITDNSSLFSKWLHANEVNILKNNII